MSTARFNTLQNASGTKSAEVEALIDGCAKAWVNFNGIGTVAIRSSLNVSSITDIGVGIFRVNFITQFPDANYSFSGNCAGNGTDYRTFMAMQDGTQASGSIQFRFANPSGVQVDSETISVIIHR